MKLTSGIEERQVISRRLAVAATLSGVLLMALLGRLVWLQLIEHQRFVTASEANRIQILPLPPARGQILDHQGVVLAENRPRLQLAVIPEESDDLDVLLFNIQSRISLTDDEIKDFRKRVSSRRRPREPVVLKDQISDEETARLAVDAFLFPEVRLDASPRRFYPFGGLTAHSLGHVGRLSLDELQDVNERRYAGTQMIGKTGIERAYEEDLLGQVGLERVETSARGQIMRTIDQEPPTPGEDIQIHLDIGLQATIFDILGDRRGAVVAMDPATGGVRALVSAPSFDANLFTGGISSALYQALQEDRDAPLFNRALRGQYPPGSTIKPMLGMVGIHYGAVTWDYSIQDPGFFQLPGISHRYRDWKPWGHGVVDMKKAVVESCDTYFYDMAVRLGVDQMAQGMAPFGFGRRLGEDILGDVPGILPSRGWKREARNESWYLGETVIAGIGQGYWVTTPLQLAAATNVMARRGSFLDPHFALKADHEGTPVNIGQPSDWLRMIKAMEAVMHGEGGTARAAGQGAAYRIAGKTGTAQVFSIGQDEKYNEDEIEERLRDHALFVGFAPAENPTLVVALIVENGGSGGTTAAPVARAIFDYWLVERESGALPPDLERVARVNETVLSRSHGYRN